MRPGAIDTKVARALTIVVARGGIAALLGTAIAVLFAGLGHRLSQALEIVALQDTLIVLQVEIAIRNEQRARLLVYRKPHREVDFLRRGLEPITGRKARGECDAQERRGWSTEEHKVRGA